MAGTIDLNVIVTGVCTYVKGPVITGGKCEYVCVIVPDGRRCSKSSRVY